MDDWTPLVIFKDLPVESRELRFPGLPPPVRLRDALPPALPAVWRASGSHQTMAAVNSSLRLFTSSFRKSSQISTWIIAIPTTKCTPPFLSHWNIAILGLLARGGSSPVKKPIPRLTESFSTSLTRSVALTQWKSLLFRVASSGEDLHLFVSLIAERIKHEGRSP